jgi:hypothetical protein
VVDHPDADRGGDSFEIVTQPWIVDDAEDAGGGVHPSSVEGARSQPPALRHVLWTELNLCTEPNGERRLKTWFRYLG